jgi:hypothetical protein
MKDNEDFMNEEPVKQMLSELGKQMHVSPEMILAYSRGVLSRDGRSKVDLHMKDCQECAEAFDLAKKFLTAEQEFDFKNIESEVDVQLSPRMKSKLKLMALLRSRKDQLVEVVAKSLLPEDSWFSIRPTVSIARNRHKYSTQIHGENTDELPVAAFSSGVGEQGKRDYEVVMKVMEFIDVIHDLLLERCKTQEVIQSELPACMNDALVMFDDLKLDEEAKNEISKVLSESLSTDGK